MGAPHRTNSAGKAENPGPPPAAPPATGHDSPAPGRIPIPRVPRDPRPATPTVHGQGNPTAASRSPLRRLSAATAARHAPATAQTIVAALALPPSPAAAPQPARPLPLTSLGQLPRDASMLYDIARVDASGRIKNHEIIKTLGWQAGDKLEMILTQGAVIIRPSPDGRFSIPQRPRIIIPLTARKRHAIGPGDHVLIAAAPDYGVLIIYPVPILNEMIARYHSTKPASESSRS
jgi:bifunctional DNA-binding transcriptional regulator/antitoxin component of YhaV-PrlF toxin-antitoxin module